MPRLASFRDEQSPFEHDDFGHREDALPEHGPHLVGQPVVEFRAARGVGDALNAEADFRKRDRADEKQVERLGRNEVHDLGFRFWTTQLGENICIEQPACHSLTSRTGSRSRLGAISMSRYGDACRAAINASPVRSPWRRRNSSAATTTTSSRPCTVTCCGPSLRTRRTNSLKRALA